MPKPLAGPELMTTPAIGTWMGVPIGAATSRPWWTVPQRPPKPDVTAPDKIRTAPPGAAARGAAAGAAGARRGTPTAGAAAAGAAATAFARALAAACCRSAALTSEVASATVGSGTTGAIVATAAGPATALLKLARAAAMPSSTTGSAVVRACWAAAANVPPTTTAATACIGVGKTDGSVLDRWAPPDPAAAARADSGGPWYARRPSGERCRDTTFPSWTPHDLARTRRPGLSAGPLGERGPCPVCDRVVIDPRTTLAALRRRVESPTAPLRPPGLEERQADAACRTGHAGVTVTIQ